MHRLLVALLACLALAVAACGAEEQAPAPSAGVAEDGVAHVHGVGVDPADGSVLVATHTGLFRAAPGSRRAERVGDRRQDTMGFTVVGPGRYLGSGHPDPSDDLPPLLGLIGSNDAGRSWTPVSLLGEADFHVLRASGRRVYGVDATSGALLVSRDGGRSWARRTPPGALVDLAIDPRDPDRVVASGEDGLFVSRDAGAGWRPLEGRRAGLLAWTGAALVLVGADGAVATSADAGRSWRAAGSAGGPPVALAASPGGELVAATADNAVRASRDGGRSWQLRVVP